MTATMWFIVMGIVIMLPLPVGALWLITNGFHRGWSDRAILCIMMVSLLLYYSALITWGGPYFQSKINALPQHEVTQCKVVTVYE